jgi:hypothetical protein
MLPSEFPNLIFDTPFDERAQCEVKSKGWVGCVKVMLQDGKTFPVVFYDIIRLGQELEDEVSAGNMFIADVGMIVLPEVTLKNMMLAVQKLAQNGYFDRLKPL